MSLFSKDISTELPDKINELRTYFYHYSGNSRRLFEIKYLYAYDEDKDEDNLFQGLLESKTSFKYDKTAKMKHDYILALNSTIYNDAKFNANDEFLTNIKNNKELKEYMNILLNSEQGPRELFNKSEQLKIYNLYKKEILKTILNIFKLDYEIKDISKIFKINSYIQYDIKQESRYGYYGFYVKYKEFCDNNNFDPNDIVFYVHVYFTSF